MEMKIQKKKTKVFDTASELYKNIIDKYFILINTMI